MDELPLGRSRVVVKRRYDVEPCAGSLVMVEDEDDKVGEPLPLEDLNAN